MQSIMKWTGTLTVTMAAGLAPLAAAVAADGQYPSKPIEIVVPFAPGGTNDVLGRLIADALNTELGQPVIVLNKPGGGASVGSTAVARAPADGYTLLVGSQGSISANPYLMPDLPYDPMKDFAPVALIGTVNNVLVVPTSFEPRTLKEFTQYAHDHPSKVNFSHAGIGTVMSLAAELYKIKTDADIVSIPYKGSAPATVAVIGGEVHSMFANTISVIEYIRAGQLQPIAVTRSVRDPLLPEVPTFQEAGVEGYEMQSWFGIFAPAGTPTAVVDKLNDVIRKALAQPERTKQLTDLGVEPGTFSVADFTGFVQNDNQNIGQLIKDAGIQITR